MQDDKQAAEKADDTPATTADEQTDTPTTPPAPDETTAPDEAAVSETPAAAEATPESPPAEANAPEPREAEPQDAPDAAQQDAAQQDTRQRDTRQRHERQGPPRNTAQQREVDRVMRRFHACGRCSTLVSACGVALGRENVRDAAAATSDGWLTLECDTGVRRLIDNAYSVSADLLAYYLDSSCPECQRRYIFIDQTDEDKGCLLKLAL